MHPGMSIEIKIDDLSGPEVAGLLAEHLAGMAAITPPGSMHALDLSKLRTPDITFWTAWENREILGCGALKQLDPAHGEIKSMRTAKAHLRRGIASALLTEIICEAKRRGYKRVSLETGATEHFAAAHALYRRFGFRDCERFGDYPENDRHSLFMTLEL